MARPIQQSSTPSRIARRIRRARNDAVFTTGDFLDLDSRSAVDAALSWLTRKERFAVSRVACIFDRA